jgi:protein phosphatase
MRGHRALPRAAGQALAVPPDALVLLIGASGSGKSTWAAAHFDAGDVLSSDGFRMMVAGDASDQSATADAFRALHLVARARLRRGLLTVVDATSVTAAARGTLRGMATAFGRPVAAVVFDVTLERCLRQNAARPGRRVPDDVVRRQHAQLQAAMPALPREGYAEIRVVGDAEMGSA